MIRRNSFRLGSNANVSGSQKITIRLLDDNEIIQLDFQPHQKGQFLMDYVCRHLNIAEKDYFGLRYVDSNKQRHWLDLGKSIVKQLKDMSPLITCVRFKFYPSDPAILKEQVTRYQLILQLRRDMMHGRLHSNETDMATLAGYVLQSELGDYDPEVHTGNYVAEYELISRQTPEFEESVMVIHQSLKGTSLAEADEAFLKKAVSLDTYGIDPHPVKDQQGEQIYLGINHTGISTFQGSRKSTHFKWSQITKLNYEAKMFIVHVCLSEDSRKGKKDTVGFKCVSFSACKYLWCCAVEQRLFFNCNSTNEIPNSVRGGGLFGTRFRYSGRVLKEVIDDPGPLRATDDVIQRTPLYRTLQRNKTGSLQGSPLQEYATLPRANHSVPLHESTRIDGGLSTSLPMHTPYSADHPTPLETLLEDSPRDVDESESTLVGDGHVLHEESTASTSREESKRSIKHVNGIIGQSEFVKEQRPLGLPFSDPPLNPFPESKDPNNHRSDNVNRKSLKEEFTLSLGLKSKVVKAKDLDSPNYIISSLLSSSASPEVKSSDFNQDESFNNWNNMKNAAQTDSELIPHIPSSPFPSSLTDSNANTVIENSSVEPVDDSLKHGGETSEGDSESTLRTSRVSRTSAAGRLLDWKKRISQDKLVSIGKIFMVSLVCVLLAALIVAILVIETDLDICIRMRRIPEVEFFSRQMYVPLKMFVRDKFRSFTSFLR